MRIIDFINAERGVPEGQYFTPLTEDQAAIQLDES